MTNPRIGDLAAQLLNMEDRGQQQSAKYIATKIEYDRLKSLPESWSDVRASKWTPEQRAAAIASGLVDANGRSLPGAV